MTAPTQTRPTPAERPAAPRWAPVLRLVTEPLALRRWAVASLTINVLIVVTGGLVRLTASGLGCPTWPRCSETSFVTHPELGVHGAIEFGNRLLTFVLVAVIALTWITALRLRDPARLDVRGGRRRDLRWLAGGLLLGIPAQIVIGGISVLTHLNPWVVGLHFVVSMALVGLAVGLVRVAHDARPDRVDRGPAVLFARLAFAGMVAAVWLGTVVTGSGPHAGDLNAVRNGLDGGVVAHVHAAAVWVTIAFTLALLVTRPEPSGAPPARRRGAAGDPRPRAVPPGRPGAARRRCTCWAPRCRSRPPRTCCSPCVGSTAPPERARTSLAWLRWATPSGRSHRASRCGSAPASTVRAGCSRTAASTCSSTGDACWWPGPDTSARVHIEAAGTSMWGARLHAGLGPTLVGVPADELRDFTVPLEQIWPGPTQRGADRAGCGRSGGCPRDLGPVGRAAPAGVPADRVAAGGAVGRHGGRRPRLQPPPAAAASAAGVRVRAAAPRPRAAARSSAGPGRSRRGLAAVAAQVGYADQAPPRP